MENYKRGKDTENITSGYYSSSIKNKDSESNQEPSELNLRNKLDNAFGDLENLRKALKDIRSNNDNIMPGTNAYYKNTNNEKHDFFSDDRYSNVMNQIKQSNQEKTKQNNFTSTSREKLAANNSYTIYKSKRENNREEKSKKFYI
jgi:hypothetical protein